MTKTSYFPLLIKYVDSNEYCICNDPKDILNGVTFKVLVVNTDFQIDLYDVSRKDTDPFTMAIKHIPTGLYVKEEDISEFKMRKELKEKLFKVLIEYYKKKES
jgi:hypothetical protein